MVSPAVPCVVWPERQVTHAEAASVMPRPGGLPAGRQGERLLMFQDFGALEKQRLERKDRHILLY